MIGIYKIISPLNKVYIGQSINIIKRFNDYKILNNCKGQIKLYNSLIKYGTENHKLEIVEECKEEQLNEREIYWGLKFNVLEEVLISFNGAYAWKINKELTLKDLRYSYKGLIKAEIIDVNPYSIAPYEISYKYIPVSSITDDEVEMSTHWVSEVCIIALTDYFIECDTSALPF